MPNRSAAAIRLARAATSVARYTCAALEATTAVLEKHKEPGHEERVEACREIRHAVERLQFMLDEFGSGAAPERTTKGVH